MKLEQIGDEIWICELIQRHDPADQTGWKGALMRLDGSVGEDGSTPREWRLS